MTDPLAAGTPNSTVHSTVHSTVDSRAVPNHDRVPGPDPVAFGARADISARSVLVTIFGDSVVPAGGEIWLGDLIDLCQQFGFNDRLVRTSMFRLGAEGWFEIERVGRRSRYRLTGWAMEEFAAAEARIYSAATAPWDGWWTLVLLDAGPLSRAEADTLRPVLLGHGFVSLSDGVLAARQDGPAPPAQVAHFMARAGVASPVPVASARFEGIGALVQAGWPAADPDLAPVAERYRAFMDRYGRWAGTDLGLLGDEASFALRTMVVHDLRRARLADPDLPLEVLGPGWPGVPARELASALYGQLAPGAERWLAKVTGLSVSADHTAARFA